MTVYSTECGHVVSVVSPHPADTRYDVPDVNAGHARWLADYREWFDDHFADEALHYARHPRCLVKPEPVSRTLPDGTQKAQIFLEKDSDFGGTAIYTVRCQYEFANAPRAAGFRWDTQVRQWWTRSPRTAAVLKHYADDPRLVAELDEFDRRSAAETRG